MKGVIQMDPLFLARLQFTIVTVYHFFFVPLTLGLSIFVAIIETMYVRTGRKTYKDAAKFWGVLFTINFAIGVATGLVQEFQFGMNWSDYSRFMGDIFGIPLALEALLAFFLESTFLGVWIFGWDKLGKKAHAATIWVVAVGSNLSAFWILVANSFMQQPVGYVLRNGRAELVDFPALITNSHVWMQFPHTVLGGVTAAGFFVLGVSAYHLLRKSKNLEVYRRSFHVGLIYATIGIVLVILSGHVQAQHLVEAQPMKMAAAEALWDTEQPAALSLFTIGDTQNREDIFAIRIPGLLSFLSCNNFTCEVQGINNIQADYEQAYGPGDYVPPVFISYWTFRIMLTAGFIMLGLALYGVYLKLRKRDILDHRRFLHLLPWALLLPYIANSTGWILTEVGRQPWIVFTLMLTADANSPTVGAGLVATSLIGYTLLYAALMVADAFLMIKYAKRGADGGDEEDAASSTPDTAQFAPAH
jgi:cytochrome d ubiquinol oxidase subunit I